MTGIVDSANLLGIKIWGSSIGVKAKRVVAGDKECWGPDQDKHLVSKHGAGGRNRTDTGWKPRGILSPKTGFLLTP
jgi:hypothetical protein